MIKKIAIALAVIGIIFYSLNDTKLDISTFSAQINKARKEKNKSFRQSENSPLATAEKASFDSLKYYPANLEFVINAAISRNEKPDTVTMQMSDNRTEKYLNWGKAKFDIEKKPQQLTIYLKASGKDSTLFIPFTDLTNGSETYGGGRYLDAPVPKLNVGELKLDFNSAYNPFCAYNNEYSCPVPPADNRLQVAIPAGEKSYHE
ncbi:DUF1684 domain-containing protein [Hymenobacter sp. BT683]|uniref:DUF1684 domain-containing protein n=1 Tax=Hymenobacter jeongseonensis TaxID=2791027 RepID=A0ABS0IF43_9BACT|nr:DUF1684 domain-containing protein [Hymenobacter jeongseonensis]MBF9236979.1 DUF1684 domain-containing protein [Hymenobacter jeongseonensis]